MKGPQPFVEIASTGRYLPADNVVTDADMEARVETSDEWIRERTGIRERRIADKYSSIPEEKVFVNVGRYGNMSSATIPVALDEAVEQGRLESGMNVLAVAFGAGFTWGGMVLRW